jgi:hypothetical protein
LVELDCPGDGHVWIFPCRLVSVVERVHNKLFKRVTKPWDIILKRLELDRGQTSLDNISESAKSVLACPQIGIVEDFHGLVKNMSLYQYSRRRELCLQQYDQH